LVAPPATSERGTSEAEAANWAPATTASLTLTDHRVYATTGTVALTYDVTPRRR
jgi:hypothetical protein